jgi:RNA polymerase sigma-70 factor (ECF subfamily)
VSFSNAARFAQPALINGSVGILFAPNGKLSRVLSVTIVNGRIIQADIIADPLRLRDLDLAVL